MIWGLALALIAGVAVYLMLPFMAPPEVETEADTELDEARTQRAAIDLDEAEGRLTEQAVVEAKEALDRRILALLNQGQTMANGARMQSLALFLVPAALLLGGIGIYAQVGNPGYEPITMADYRSQQAADLPQSLDSLVLELRSRLEADPNPPADGYVLLARSYLRLGNVEEGLAAYEVAVELSGGQAEIVAERDRVIAMLEQRTTPQIDPEAMARIEAMSPDEQAVMIEGMVEGLAVRLEQEPNDMAGWQRLIRARIVMGQIEQARTDLAAAQSIFADNPQQLAALQPLITELAPLSNQTPSE